MKPLDLFFITRTNCPFEMQKRTSPLHSIVFNGLVVEDTVEQTTTIDDAKNISTSVSGHLSLARSGAFVPEVFMPSTVHIVVSQAVQRQLAHVRGVDLMPVKYSRLVDLPMPLLGDTSWFKHVKYPPGPKVEREILGRPDIPALHNVVPPYYTLLAPSTYQIRTRVDDIAPVTVNYGSYYGQPSDSVLVSRRVLSHCPVTWDKAFIIREDVFEVLAPHLDRDYVSIAWAYLKDAGG